MILVVVLSFIIMSIPYFYRPSPKALSRSQVEQIMKMFPHRPLINSEWKTNPIHINEINVDSLIRLGIDKKLARRIIKYRDAIGGFKSLKSFTKVYGMPDSIVEQVQLIFTPEDNNIKTNTAMRTPPEPKSYDILDINDVHVEELITSYGFAPKVAARIVKYRDAIGGFTDMETVKKVYGIDTALLKKLSIRFTKPYEDTKEAASHSLDQSNVRTPEIDINNSSVSDLISFGLDSTLSERIFKYGKLIGTYKNINQLRKVYGLDLSVIERYQWRFDTTQAVQDSFEQKKIADRKDINTATIADLVKIKGIGPVFAKRIISYRDLLGGFYAIDQIKETQGLFDEGYEAISSRVSISSPVESIDLTKVDLKKLAAHPYFTKRQVDLIRKMRQEGVMITEASLREYGVVSSKEWDRIRPYIYPRIKK